ncbi:MAG: hypothetical protein ACR2NU_02210 [Aeoliella sp.]
MKTPAHQNHRSSSRHGSVLVCVIVCLSIVIALVTATTQSALRERRQIRVERQLRQADILVEAGAGRAVTKLNQSERYTGETWSLDADSLPGFEEARILIVAPRVDGDQPRLIRITAELSVVTQLPAELQRPVRRSFEFVFHRSAFPATPKE